MATPEWLRNKMNTYKTHDGLNRSTNALVIDDFPLDDLTKDLSADVFVDEKEAFFLAETSGEDCAQVTRQCASPQSPEELASDFIYPLETQRASSPSRRPAKKKVLTKKISKNTGLSKTTTRKPVSSPVLIPCYQQTKPKQNKSPSHAVKKCNSAELPSITERLGQLRPSRELLEYYRKKIAEYDDEHNKVVNKVEKYKDTFEESGRLQWELQQREEEIAELQKALSDMQIFLFQEKEHVLRLYAENDRLKLRELEDKQKIQQLLSLGNYPSGEVTYFHKEPPAKAIIEQKYPYKQDNNTSAKLCSKKKQIHNPEENDNKILSLQIECLQAQLEEQTKHAKENVEALVADRKVKEEELEARRLRDEEKIRVLLEKLQKTQDLLYDSTKDFLQLRYVQRSNERNWMSEKDQLLQQLDKIQECFQKKCSETRFMPSSGAHALSTCTNTHSAVGVNTGTMAAPNTLAVGQQYFERDDPQVEEEIKNLEFELEQTQKMSEMYREQAISMEEELSRIREEGDVTREIFKERSNKMSKRLQMMNTRYQELEKRRHFEVEGFKNDIKNLRSRLKDVERQLYKVTLGLAEEMDEKRPDDLDLRILRNVRLSTGRSQKIMGELKNLKSKVYSLENDLRQL